MEKSYTERCEEDYRKWQFKLQVSDDVVNEATVARDSLLASFNSANLVFCSGGTKIIKGDLSPGCKTCMNGTVSFLYINGLCTRNCFFCPQNRRMESERAPISAELTFNDPDLYVEYLYKCGFKGVGITGGEPLMVFERLLLFLKSIKNKFDRNMYTWIYTNGDLLDEYKLTELKNAGLDEIRFNLSARDYDLEPVILSRRFFDAITIEIPTMPEDEMIVRVIMQEIAKIGVRNLNLHPLSLSKYNLKNVLARNYLIIHSPYNSPIVFDSEMTALSLMKYAAEKQFDFSLNYCTRLFKKIYQSCGLRKRFANYAKAKFESISDSGYVMRLSLKDSAENIGKIISVFEKSSVCSSLWKVEKNNSELFFHVDLISLIPSDKSNLSLMCFEALVVPGLLRNEMEAGSNDKLPVGLKLVMKEENLSSGIIKAFISGLFPQSSEKHQIFRDFKHLVELEEDSLRLVSTREYWQKIKGQAFFSKATSNV
ncbi:MAG: radical SAM protein [Candidatus Riflebacteria bacterium]|nr:radical SAM protein [Candidatus Riflebacteria bacterium]